MIETIQRQSSGLFMLRNVVIWHYSTIVWFVSLFLIGFLIILSVLPSKYTATAALLLDVRRSQPLIDAQANSPVDSSVVETQIEILKSDSVAVAVMDSLRLWDDAEFTSGGLLTQAIERAAEFFGSRGPTSGREAALKAFKRGLSVRQSGHSYIAEVSYTSLAADRAADIANAITKAYISDLFQAKNANAERANVWLLKTSRKFLEEASKAEQDVEEFKAANLMASAGNVLDSDDLKQSRVKLRALEANAQAYRQIYEEFLSRTGQALPQHTFPVTDARVIGPALTPLTPSSPRWGLTALLAGLAGCSIGVLFGFVKEHLSQRVRGPELLEEIGLKSFANVPLIKRQSLSPRKRKLKPLYSAAMAQSLLRAKLKLHNVFAETDACVIGIVSAGSGEGKTTIAYNLAALLAEDGRTALIDWNLRSPRLSEVLVPPLKKGAAVQEGSETFRKNEIGFEFAPAPNLKYNEHMPAALVSQKARETFNAARKQFRFTIVDLPSAAHVDVCIVAPLIDSFLLVVETGRNDLFELRRIVASAGISQRIAGAIINKTRRQACE